MSLTKVLALAAFLAPCTAIAQARPYMEVRGTWVRAGTTENQWDASSPRYDLSYGGGYGVHASAGVALRRWRIGLEAGFLRADPHRSSPAPGVSFVASDRYRTVLAGVFHERAMAKPVSIFVGAGAGLVARRARLEQDAPAPSRSGKIESESAGVFGEVGASLRVVERLGLTAAFRMLSHNDGRATRSNNVWIGVRVR
ncbi:MAG: hypothetical protein HOP28_17585 [Gemmatimonadales bacterium]|nr:hypothetical protein [Gemmatimonadales bacterium]